MGRRLSHLVIGGTGFVGAGVVKRLRGLGCEVATFHRSAGADVRGDRRDLPAFRERFARLAPEVVVDTIAYTVRDAVSLVSTFRGIAGRLVVLSSQDVYATYGRFLGLEEGAPEAAPASEDAPLRRSRYPYRTKARGPEDMAYEYDKILVEEAVAGHTDLPAAVLRLPCVYGPRDQQHRLREYLARMDEGAPSILIEGAKASWRWTRGYVENVADAIALAAIDARAAGRTYNLGEPEALSEAHWVREIGLAAGWKGAVRATARGDRPARPAEPYDFAHDLVADTRRIREELGYCERVGRAEALRATVTSEREHPIENQTLEG